MEIGQGSGAGKSEQVSLGEEVHASKGSKDEYVQQLSQDMFTKLSEYLQNELKVSCADYKLLEKMNQVALEKYISMGKLAESYNTVYRELTEKYGQLGGYLDQIERIESGVTLLEENVDALDQYCNRLEERYEKIMASYDEA
eukprot:Nk52_evm101s221 gene=Nk52_evmTU101s221